MSVRDLNFGDAHTSGDADGLMVYEPVYAFGHWNPCKIFNFIQVQVESPTKTLDLLELSPSHLVFVQGKNHPVVAERLQPGDVLQASGGERGVQVLHIQTVTRRDGVFAPLTLSWRIMVNGVTASETSWGRVC